jgi:hypothetical protein
MIGALGCPVVCARDAIQYQVERSPLYLDSCVFGQFIGTDIGDPQLRYRNLQLSDISPLPDQTADKTWFQEPRSCLA